MKRTILLLMLGTSLSTCLFADPDRLKSQEWLAMPEDSKLSYVSIAADSLRADGVPLGIPADYYVGDLDRFFEAKPSRRALSISEILPALVYEKDPVARATMDMLITKKIISKPQSLEV